MMSIPYPAPSAPRVAPIEPPSGSSAIAAAGFVPETPSKWVHDSARSACKACHSPFSFIKRRHHCRNCREVFCDACTNYRLLTPDAADPKRLLSVRACKACFNQFKGRKTRGTPKGAKPLPRAAATAATAAAPNKALPTASTAQLSTDNVKLSSPTYGAAAAAPAEPQARGGFYVQRLNSDGLDAIELRSDDTDGGRKQDDDHDDDDGGDDTDGNGEFEMEDDFLGEIFEEDDDDDNDEFAAPPAVSTVNLATSAPSQQQVDVDKVEKPAVPATPPHVSKSMEMEPVVGKAGPRAVEGGRRLQVGEKDEFERQGRDREGQQELLNIPADALADVGFRSRTSATAPLQPAPVLQSEEAFTERNVEHRHIAPPSPITGVADLMQLASPSAVPQPLLNTLNDPRSGPEDVARLVHATPKIGPPVFATVGPAAAGRAPLVSPDTANKPRATDKKPTTAPPAGSATLTSATQSSAAKPVVISPFVSVLSSTPSFNTANEAPTAAPAVHSAASSASTAAAVSRPSAVPINPSVDVPSWPASAADARPHSTALPHPVTASTVELPPQAQLAAPAALVDGGDVSHVAHYTGRVHPRDSNAEPGSKRYVVKKQRVERAASWWAALLRPAPLAGLALLAVVFMAVFPLPVTICVTLLAVMVPVLLCSNRGRVGPSVRREQPGRSAEHDALKQNVSHHRQSAKAGGGMVGSTGSSSSSPYQGHASHAQHHAPAADGSAVLQQSAIERETASASIPKQMAPRPPMIV